MSFLQTVGIASQASDQFDRQRRGDRVAAMQEESMQRALQADKLDSEIFKLGVQYMMQREQQKAAQKAALLGKSRVAPQAAVPSMVPGELGGSRPESAYDRPENSYAQGGEVKATTPKFHGIYDDALFTGEKTPTIISDMVNDWSVEGYQPYQHLETAVNDVVRMAQGGAVGGDIYNGVQMYADGGEVQPQGLWAHVKSMLGMKAGGPVPPKAAVKMKGKKPKGGKVKGPGTGTSDSVPASLDGKKGAVALSNGEYVLPKKMVDAIGVENLDRERQKYI